MSKIKFIVDSTVDISLEELKELDVDVLPLHVTIGNESYDDLLTLNTTKLFELIKKNGVMPKTGAVTPFIFEEIFRKYVEQGFDVIYVGLGSQLSSTYNNAVTAKEAIGHNVYVVDSNNLSSSTALILMKMIKWSKEGKEAKDIVEDIKEIVPKVRCSFALNTMKYLYMGGRCKAISYYAGKILHIHPIISVVDGGMKVSKLPRGNMIKAINLLVEDFKEDYVNGNVDLDRIMITHCLNPDMRDYILTKMREFMPDMRMVKSSESGCVISSHCGEECIGILYISKK